MGPELVIIKRGEYGALVYRDNNFFYVPAYPLENVIDPTGAGDCFAGGFMGYLARAGSTEWPVLCQAMVAGSALASFCVEDFSIRRFSSLRSDELAARIEQFRGLTDFQPLAPLA
jgi:sugar/nucleoside kinase (ribokinase family)